MNKIGSLLVLLAVGIGSAGILFSIEYVYYRKRTVSWKKKTGLEKSRMGSIKSQVDETESENRPTAPVATTHSSCRERRSVQRVLCLSCFLRLWKNNRVSRKPCKRRSDLVLSGQMRVPK